MAKISKNARVANRGKLGQKFFKGKKVKPIVIKSMTGKSVVAVFDEASGSLLMSDQSSAQKNNYVTWDSIAGLLTDTQ